MTKIDLLIADIRLPGINGLELMERLLKLQPETKVILITGVTDPQVQKQVAEAGADAYYIKPVDLGDFLKSVERILGIVMGEMALAMMEDEEEEPDTGVSDRLARLRQDLKAETAIMLNDNGQVVVRAGEMPNERMETALVNALMGVFSTSNKMAHLLENPVPENLLFFQGNKHNLITAHVGQSYLLLIVLARPSQPGINNEQVLLTQQAVQDLIKLLSNIGISVETGEETHEGVPLEPEGEPLVEDQISTDLDVDLQDVLEKAEEDKVKGEELDTFWEPSEEGSGAGSISADALSYEQALQLGLAPSEDED